MPIAAPADGFHRGKILRFSFTRGGIKRYQIKFTTFEGPPRVLPETLLTRVPRLTDNVPVSLSPPPNVTPSTYIHCPKCGFGCVPTAVQCLLCGSAVTTRSSRRSPGSPRQHKSQPQVPRDIATLPRNTGFPAKGGGNTNNPAHESGGNITLGGHSIGSDIKAVKLTFGSGFEIINDADPLEIDPAELHKLLSKRHHIMDHEILPLNIAHDRMNHLNYADLLKLQKVSKNFTLEHTHAEFCEDCILCKMTRKEHIGMKLEESEVGVLYHSDSGEMEVATPTGYKCYFLFIEHVSSMAYVYFTKTQTTEDLIACLELLARDTGRLPKRLHSDCGPAYISTSMNAYAIKNKIEQTFSTPYHKNQNGKVERLTRTIKDGIRTMLHAAAAPEWLWPYAFSHMIYTRNRSPSAALNGRTPYEVRFERTPDLSPLRVWGCSCYYLIQSDTETLKPRARKGFLLGMGKRGSRHSYHVGTISETGRFVVTTTSDVVFNENEKFFATLPESLSGLLEGQVPLQLMIDALCPNIKIPVSEEVNAIDDADGVFVDLANYREAMQRAPEEAAKWKAGADKEWLDNCMKNAVEGEYSEKEVRKNGHIPLRSHLVLKRKPAVPSLGKPEEFKARACVNGDTEDPNNIGSTFAPTINYIVVRLLFVAYAKCKNMISDWVIRSGDVSNAFARVLLPESKTVYIYAPQPYHKPGFVYKLKTALYGLKESPKLWQIISEVC